MTEIAEINAVHNQLLKFIHERDVSPTDRWHFIYLKGSFRIVPASQGGPAGTVLATFNETQLRSGLTRRQWSRVRNGIARELGFYGDK